MEEILDLTDLQETQLENREYASKGKRFGNYIIDLLGYYILSSIIGAIIGVGLVVIGQENILYDVEESIEYKIGSWIFGMMVILVYYTLTEYFFKGKTLGKLITKTRAVNEDNSRMDFATSLKRSLCRLIPFEAVSFLGSDYGGLHDSISKTKVVVD